MKRKVYDDDFKKSALERMKTEAVSAIAADLKVSDSMLYSWKAKAAGRKKSKKKGYKLGRSANVHAFRKLVTKADAKKVSVHDAIVYLRKAQALEDTALIHALGQLALGALEGKL